MSTNESSSLQTGGPGSSRVGVPGIVGILTYLAGVAAFLLYVLIVSGPSISHRAVAAVRRAAPRSSLQEKPSQLADLTFLGAFADIGRTATPHSGDHGWRPRQSRPRVEVCLLVVWETAASCGVGSPNTSCCHFAGQPWQCFSIWLFAAAFFHRGPASRRRVHSAFAPRLPGRTLLGTGSAKTQAIG